MLHGILLHDSDLYEESRLNKFSAKSKGA
jgi:hypothetical protein